jgi:Fe2+ or Zn2+ uptake regulation protein
MGDTGRGDAATLLALAGIGPTTLRLAVAEALAAADQPLADGDILARVRHGHRVNKVTLYRILDLFVDKGLAGRHSLGDRAFRYCLGSRFSRHPHCHLRCVRCGRTMCLPAGEGLMDLSALGEGMGMRVVGVEVRIDGVCAACGEEDAAGAASVDAVGGKT